MKYILLVVIIKGDPIYTSDFSNTLPRILIGYIKNIKKNDLEDIIEVDYLKIDSLYVVII